MTSAYWRHVYTKLLTHHRSFLMKKIGRQDHTLRCYRSFTLAINPFAWTFGISTLKECVENEIKTHCQDWKKLRLLPRENLNREKNFTVQDRSIEWKHHLEKVQMNICKESGGRATRLREWDEQTARPLFSTSPFLLSQYLEIRPVNWYPC